MMLRVVLTHWSLPFGHTSLPGELGKLPGQPRGVSWYTGDRQLLDLYLVCICAVVAWDGHVW